MSSYVYRKAKRHIRLISRWTNITSRFGSNFRLSCLPIFSKVSYDRRGPTALIPILFVGAVLPHWGECPRPVQTINSTAWTTLALITLLVVGSRSHLRARRTRACTASAAAIGEQHCRLARILNSEPSQLLAEQFYSFKQRNKRSLGVKEN